MIRCTVKVVVLVVEKVLSELAILAAILSIAEPGSYIDRAVGGMASIFQIVYGFARAYWNDVGVREALAEFGTGTLKALGGVGENIQSDPRMVLIAFIATYAAYKVIAIILGVIRRKLLRRRKEKFEKPGSEPTDRKGGRTFDHLYEDVQNPSSQSRERSEDI